MNPAFKVGDFIKRKDFYSNNPGDFMQKGSIYTVSECGLGWVCVHGSAMDYHPDSFELVESAADDVNHPSHYTAHPAGIECIDVTEGFNFNCGNAIKYIWRAGLKSDNAIEDLKKSRFYIDRELDRIGRQS